MAYTISKYNAYEAVYGYQAWKASFIGSLPRTGSNTSTSTAPASQQAFPTSAYGQTVPVVYGKARLPGAYIWAPEILVRTTTTGALLTTTTVTVNLSCRVRFARPLVADSRWRVRRMWADGTLLLDKSTGYRRSGLNIREYDGYSTQGRDPTMTNAEGTSNVSAHRGYLDVVITNYNLGVAGAPPPAFEAEWVQDPSTSHDVDVTTGLFSDAVDSFAAADWENGIWYGITNTPDYFRAFHIGTNQEIYALPVTGLTGFSMDENGIRYVPSINRVIIGQVFITIGTNVVPTLIDPETGEVLSIGETIGDILNTATVVSFGSVGCYVSAAFSEGQIAIHRFTADEIVRTHFSGIDWDGRAEIQCIAPGEIRTSDADVYLAGETKLYKTTLNANGYFLTITELYTAADDLVYCVYHDGDVLVWNDSGDIISVDATTGAVNWTVTVPYQIGSDASISSLAPPDLHRLDGVLMVETTGTYYFTDLETGATTSESKSSASVGKFVYDGVGDVGINTDRGVEVARQVNFDAVGDGSSWPLEDFLTELMVAGGFESSEITCEGFDDEILGAVIDISGGVRDIARQVCDPYSIAIFERADQIVFKRAETDGSFAVDVTVGTNDVLDRGGQAISATKFNPQEKPAKYGLNYRDPDEVYQSRPQWGEIPSLPLPVAVTDIGIKADIPIIIEADTAKVLATKRIYRDAVQVHEFQMSLKAEHLKIEPETISQFTYANRVVTGRVLENTIHPNFTNTIVVTEFLSSASVTISGAVGRPIEPEEVGSALSRYVHLDIPLRSDTHDLMGDGLLQYHALVSGGQPFWPGATLYRKDGGTYIPQGSQVEDGLRGIALEALPDVEIPYVTEFDRTLRVAFASTVDLPASVTYEEMLSQNVNYFAIGAPGRWEIVQVQTITNNGDGSTTLETFRRCLDQSEEYTGDHEVGDEVIYLSGDNILGLEYGLTDLGASKDFKAVGIGSSVGETPTVYNRTITGEAEKIPKPVIAVERDGTKLVITLGPRTRVGSFWHDDGTDEYSTPPDPLLDGWEIDILDAPNGSVLRSFDLAANVLTQDYTDAEQTTDFGSTVDPGEEITIAARALSSVGVVCPTRETTITL